MAWDISRIKKRHFPLIESNPKPLANRNPLHPRHESMASANPDEVWYLLGTPPTPSLRGCPYGLPTCLPLQLLTGSCGQVRRRRPTLSSVREANAVLGGVPHPWLPQDTEESFLEQLPGWRCRWWWWTQRWGVPRPALWHLFGRPRRPPLRCCTGGLYSCLPLLLHGGLGHREGGSAATSLPNMPRTHDRVDQPLRGPRNFKDWTRSLGTGRLHRWWWDWHCWGRAWPTASSSCPS